MNIQKDMLLYKNEFPFGPFVTRLKLIKEIREMAFRGLQKMFRPEERLFIYRMIKLGDQLVSQGLSHRYTAIAVIGLSGEDNLAVRDALNGLSLRDICERLVQDIGKVGNLGDVALTLWACNVSGYNVRDDVIDALYRLKPAEGNYATVELAWALDALCLEHSSRLDQLRYGIGQRLVRSFNQRSGAFPHWIGTNGNKLRSHVSCFADMVYPIHALSNFARRSGDQPALAAVQCCADLICKLQGRSGQWWWHYDYRTGKVVEHYPVYSVHQDAMAPMALFALMEAGKGNYSDAIARGLDWIYLPSEVKFPLSDEKADLIWRKVGRREPKKASRYIQAVASKLHPALRMPAMDIVFPANRVDYEDRPYHLGWVLFAWNQTRLRFIS